jgi:hypothetical protein
MAGDTRRTIRLALTDAEWRALEAAAAKEDRSLSYFVTRLVRAQLTPQRKRGTRKPTESL